MIGLDAVLKTRLVTDVANALDTALPSGTGATKTIGASSIRRGVQTGVLDADNPDSYLDAIAMRRTRPR